MLHCGLQVCNYVKCRVMITITEGGAVRQHATHVNTEREAELSTIIRGKGGQRFVSYLY